MTNTIATSGYIGDKSFEERNRALKAMASQAGLRLPETRVPEGESLWESGEARRRALKDELDKLPNAGDALAALRHRIKLEAPKDVKVKIGQVRMEPKRGGLYGGNGHSAEKALAYTVHGFGQVVQAVKPVNVRQGATSTLLALSPRIRADAFNHFAGQACRSDEVVIRTLREPASGRRVVRALVSERHSQESGDDGAVCDALSGMPDILRAAKMRVTRDLNRTDLELIWPALDREIRIGDVVKIAVQITNLETSSCAVRIDAKLLRVLCYNFTTAYSEGGDEDIELRHVGDLRVKLPDAIQRAILRVEPFIRAYGDAYRLALPETRGEALNRAGVRFELPARVLDSASKLWDADGEKSAGNTIAGLANALTRASQDEDMAMAQVVERAAGRIIATGWAALE